MQWETQSVGAAPAPSPAVLRGRLGALLRGEPGPHSLDAVGFAVRLGP